MTKRTAGERRYRALKRKVESSRSTLEWLQRQMQDADNAGRQTRQLYIMQEITRAIEGLKNV